MKNLLLCCDWGTTSFRLRLVNIPDQEIIGEILSADGVALVYDAWKAVEEGEEDKQRFFLNHLNRQIALLASQLNIHLDIVPIVISGMASSSIGIYEVPYAVLPFNSDGGQVNVRRIDSNENFLHEILLISGIRSDDDVMRGEETQWIGLTGLLKLPVQDTIFIFPGTHSKHLYVKKQQLVDFQTFMTGEIFRIVSSHSILKESIEISVLPDFTDEELKGFCSGVRDSLEMSVLKALFRVRTNQLFEKLDKKENALYLSGLLIGSEIKHLLDEIDAQLVLCSGNNLYELYKLALEQLHLADRTTIVSPEIADKASVAGQIKIFQNQNLLLNNINL